MRRLFSMRMLNLTARLQRHEQGQSLVLLAIGFVALALFVGITTDVSVLFARYSQLARAVDSAAISAANQVREDRNYANVRLAATQFIEIYGLDPEQIDVQYCDTLPATERTTDELCVDFAGNAHNRKLVRVTARVEAPTYFMRLLGIDVIELEASSISETAALDVVVIMDVSESMLRYTSYEDWATIGQGVIYRPPTRDEIATDLGLGTGWEAWTTLMTDASTAQTGLLYRTQAYVNSLLDYGDSSDPFYVASNSTYFQAEYGSQSAPREPCRVRFYPPGVQSSVSSFTGYGDPDAGYTNLRDLYDEVSLDWPTSMVGWDVFVPSYNYYGCCNDPNGDWRFGDLICQPFKQARDAVLQFMDRIDFNRGDRVAFVTFDRGAYLINPYGVPIIGGTPDEDARLNPMISNRDDAVNTIRNLLGVRAEPNFYVFNDDGTYVEGSTNRLTAYWSSYAAGIENGASIPLDPGRTDYDPNPTTGIVPEMVNYPVRGNCSVQNAALLYQYDSLFAPSLWRIANPSDPAWTGYADGLEQFNFDWPGIGTIRNVGMSYEYWAACAGTNVGAGLRVANNALVDPETIRDDGVWVMVLLSDGGAGASDAVRRDRQKINPILPYFDNLDGTFGYEDPTVDEYGSFGLCPTGSPSNPAELMRPADDSPSAYTFPHCSDEQWWTRHRCDFRPLRIVLFGQNDAMQDADYDPALSEEENLRLNNLYDVDIGQPGVNCNVERYDVDDYARDWADFVGLQAIAGSGAQEANLPTIFTIGFGLEFPIRSDGGTTYTITDQNDAEEICALNPGDCLGEQLLRYIADVGDNNFIDNDYYQDMLFCDRQDALDGRCSAHGAYGVGLFPMESWSWDGIPGDIRGYGQRGPCQTELGIVIGSTYDLNADGSFDAGERNLQREMLRPQLSCGNYYFAPDGNELRFVFDDIASRMYTRLAR